MLLCVNRAKSGGLSRVVSSIRVHNELLSQSPWHLGALYSPFAIDMRGEQAVGEPPIYYRPVFSFFDGKLSAGANRTYIRSGQSLVGRPLNDAQSEALDAFYEMCDEHALEMDLAEGDIQIQNSYITMHDRTEYVDHPEPERFRRMLRLWLTSLYPRRLAPDFGTYNFERKCVIGYRSKE
jgi:hypothetical protein